MAGKTDIAWTDFSWNPIRGCSRVSAGCQRCYAERQAIRQIGSGYAGLIQRTSHGPAWTGKVRVVDKLLDQPLHWKDPRRIFVNSMSDLFHENVSFESIASIFAVMGVTTRHTYQVLTKRPERMRAFFEWAMEGKSPSAFGADDRIQFYWPKAIPWKALGKNRGFGYDNCGPAFPYANVWLGTSVEDQETADERIPLLLQTPAAVRFVSYEPALGPVDFTDYLHDSNCLEVEARGTECTCSEPREVHLDWVIAGGESGPKARQCDIAWIRSTVEQCKAASIPVFVKQLGADPQFDQGCGDCDPCIGGGQCCVGAIKIRLDLEDRKGGDMAEWPEDLRVREFPK